MIVTYKAEVYGRRIDYAYDPIKDNLNLGGRYGDLSILILDEQYFSLSKNNTIEIRKGIDDLADEFPIFFMRCLKEKLKIMGITIRYRSKPKCIFTIEKDEDYSFFLLAFSDNIHTNKRVKK